MLRFVGLLVYVSHLFLIASLGTEDPSATTPSLPTSDQGSGWDPWG